jgi:hypothetical protein
VFIALRSTVTVDLDNGSEQGSQRLTGPDTGLLLKAGVWIRLREFSSETALVVLSSKAYADIEHFQGPNPALLGVAER